jgi:phosphate transport system permease protein
VSNLTSHIPAYMPTWRLYKDRLATLTISAGGASVLMAILLIFFYLLYEVMPLFSGATMEKSNELQLPANNGATVYSAMEEQGEVAFIIDSNWQAKFFNIASSEVLGSVDLVADSGPIVSFASESGDSRLLGVSHIDGRVNLFKHEYALSYPNGERLITPRLESLYAEEDLGFEGLPLKSLAIRDGEE